MPTEQESLSAKVQSSYQQLSKVAADLNAVSDELGTCIADLDAALKKLNLGVTKWVQIRGMTRTRKRETSRWITLGTQKLVGIGELGSAR